MRFVSHNDRKAVARLLKPIYAAATLTDAESVKVAFTEPDMGRKHPMDDLQPLGAPEVVT